MERPYLIVPLVCTEKDRQAVIILFFFLQLDLYFVLCNCLFLHLLENPNPSVNLPQTYTLLESKVAYGTFSRLATALSLKSDKFTITLAFNSKYYSTLK